MSDGTTGSDSKTSVARTCGSCGFPLERAFRFCPGCAAPARSKLLEVFEGHPAIDDSSARTLRVSRYLGGFPEERHTRVSTWSSDGTAEAAISIDEDETARLAAFLGPHPGRAGVRAAQSWARGVLRRLLSPR